MIESIEDFWEVVNYNGGIVKFTFKTICGCSLVYFSLIGLIILGG